MSGPSTNAMQFDKARGETQGQVEPVLYFTGAQSLRAGYYDENLNRTAVSVIDRGTQAATSGVIAALGLRSREWRRSWPAGARHRRTCVGVDSCRPSCDDASAR